MASLFSSPQKQATSAAQAQQGITAQEIGSSGEPMPPGASGLEGYIAQQQGDLRNAIAGTGANPYFTAASAMNSNKYAVNPQDTAAFGSTPPPGSLSGAPTVSGNTRANFFAPPPMPNTGAGSANASSSSAGSAAPSGKNAFAPPPSYNTAVGDFLSGAPIAAPSEPGLFYGTGGMTGGYNPAGGP